MKREDLIIQRAVNNPTQHYIRRALVAAEAKKRKAEIKREFEEFLRESMDGLHQE